MWYSHMIPTENLCTGQTTRKKALFIDNFRGFCSHFSFGRVFIFALGGRLRHVQSCSEAMPRSVLRNDPYVVLKIKIMWYASKAIPYILSCLSGPRVTFKMSSLNAQGPVLMVFVEVPIGKINRHDYEAEVDMLQCCISLGCIWHFLFLCSISKRWEISI